MPKKPLSNGLLDVVHVNDPFYPGLIQEGSKNRIYVFQFPAYIRGSATDRNEYPVAFYIGQTDPSRGWIVDGEFLVRWEDGDYSKCPEKPKLLFWIDVCEGISDHDIRQLMRKYGWVKTLLEYPGFGSTEMVMHPTLKDWDVAIRQVKHEVTKIDSYYHEYSKKYGITPAFADKKAKKKEEDLHRVPDRQAVYDQCEKYANLPKDAKIFIWRDAHGVYSDYLTSMGFVNLYVEDDYEYFPQEERRSLTGCADVTLISKEERDKMHFDVVTGNPPYSDRSGVDGGGGGGCSKDLDDKFYLDSMKMSDYVSLIIRAKHFTKERSKFKKMLFESGNLVSIEYLPKETFKSIQNTTTCIVTWNKNYKGPCKVKFKDGTVIEQKLKSTDVIIADNPIIIEQVEHNLAWRYLNGKLYRNKIAEIEDPNGAPLVEICGDGHSPVIRYVKRGYEEAGRNQHGVVMNINASWGGLGKVMIKPYEASLTFNVVCLKTSSEKESILLKKYLESQHIKDIVAKTMASFHPTKQMFKSIPDLPDAK
jgi:hypothetical protein